MSDTKKLIDAAQRLNDALMDERNAVSEVRAKLEAEQKKVAQRNDDISDREAAVLAREQAVKGIESANAILARAEEVKRENRQIENEIASRNLKAAENEKAAKEAMGKLEREIFDFNEAKRAHSVTRREFLEQKAEFEKKVAELGINV